MNKAEWYLVEKALSGTWGSVDLEIDGFKITLQRGLISKNRLGITTYVNGWVRGAWILDFTLRESDFLRPTKRYIYSAKMRNDIKKLKKRLTKHTVEIARSLDPDKVYRGRSPFWGSVSGIREHYEKTFTDIKLIKINGVEQKIENGAREA